MTTQCHEEVPDRDGWASPCDHPAVTTRTDDDGHTYPVCELHKENR